MSNQFAYLRPTTEQFQMSNTQRTAHEFAQVDGSIAKIGITDFAQAALGDIVFVDLPEVGDDVEKGESFGSVESVKAASDIYSPVSGVVTEVNEVLSDEPGTVNTAAESDGWFIKVEMSDTSEVRRGGGVGGGLCTVLCCY